MKTGTKIYASIIGLSGIVIAIYCIWQFFWISDSLSLTRLPVTIALTLISILCRCLPLQIREDCKVDMSFISILAIILVSGPYAAVAITFLTTPFVLYPLESEAKKIKHIFNTDPIKTLFNAGNLSITIFWAGLVFLATGGTPGRIELPQALLPAALYIILSIVINSAIMMGLFHVEQKLTFFPTIFQMFFQLLPSIACTAPIGFFLAILIQMEGGAYLAFLFMLPLLLARFSFKLFLESRRQQLNMIQALTATLEAKDTYTEGHSRRVSSYAQSIARAMELPQKQVERIALAGMLHDIGKIGVDDSILRKPGALTSEERLQIQRHPEIGAHILEKVDAYREIIDIVLHHHEFYDGNGYPGKTSGDEISIEAYVLSVADAFDAMTSQRPYRNPMPIARARAILLEEKGKQFHPQVAQVAIDLIDREILLPSLSRIESSARS